jgi:hypothetical protein
MPGDFATAININYRSRISWSIRDCGSAASGINRRVLEQDQGVWSFISHYFSMEVTLNIQRILIID